MVTTSTVGTTCTMCRSDPCAAASSAANCTAVAEDGEPSVATRIRFISGSARFDAGEGHSYPRSGELQGSGEELARFRGDHRPAGGTPLRPEGRHRSGSPWSPKCRSCPRADQATVAPRRGDGARETPWFVGPTTPVWRPDSQGVERAGSPPPPRTPGLTDQRTAPGYGPGRSTGAMGPPGRSVLRHQQIDVPPTMAR